MNDEKIEHLRLLAYQKQSQARPATVNSLVGALKNHLGIPFLIAGLRSIKLLSYEKYEYFEENTVNVLEVCSFILGYLIPLGKRRRGWHKLLSIIDRLIIVLRFKILASKCVKLYRLSKRPVLRPEEPPITLNVSDVAEAPEVAVTDFESTTDKIQGLRTEIFVELIDFLLLLYPKSITQLVYDRLFNKKS